MFESPATDQKAKYKLSLSAAKFEDNDHQLITETSFNNNLNTSGIG